MALPPVIETERLLLRPFAPGDAEAAFQSFGDPAVMRFISGGPDTSVAATHERLLKYARHQEEHGFSKWAVVCKESGQLVGDSGLMWLPDSSDVELGYRFRRNCWGRGYATEAARAWLHSAFEYTALHSVIAFTHPDNRFSIRVMEKLGMIPRGKARYYDMDVLVYVATKSEVVGAR